MIIDIIGYFFANTFIIPDKYHEEMFFYEFLCVYYNKYLYLH